jgi:hypothetical protein
VSAWAALNGAALWTRPRGSGSSRTTSRISSANASTSAAASSGLPVAFLHGFIYLAARGRRERAQKQRVGNGCNAHRWFRPVRIRRYEAIAVPIAGRNLLLTRLALSLIDHRHVGLLRALQQRLSCSAQVKMVSFVTSTRELRSLSGDPEDEEFPFTRSVRDLETAYSEVAKSRVA